MTRERCLWPGLVVLVVAGVFLIYGRVLHLGWSYRDDLSILKNVEENPWYLPGKAAGLPPLRRSPAGVFRPMQFLAFKVSSMLWERNPLPLHLFSLLLHAANALLLSWLLWRLTRSYGTAVASSLLFVAQVSPEAVGWIAANCDLLCLFFLLGSAVFLHSVCRGRLVFLLPSLICFGSALGSKEAAVVFPVLVTAVVVFCSQLGRCRKLLVAGLFWLLLIGFCLVRLHVRAPLAGNISWYWRYPMRVARYYFLYVGPHFYTFLLFWAKAPLTALKCYLVGPVCALASVALLTGGILTQGLRWQSLLKRTGYVLVAFVLAGVCYLFLFDVGRKALLALQFWVAVGFLGVALTGRWRGLGWLAVCWVVLFAVPPAMLLLYGHYASRYFYVPDLGKLMLAVLVSQRYGGWWRWLVSGACAAYVFSQSYGAFAGVLAFYYPC